MINPRQVVHFHMQQKPRHTNPTFNSSFVFGSLHAYGNTQYTKALLKDTQYKDHYDINKKVNNTIVPTFNISRRAGPHQINMGQAIEKQNIGDNNNNKMTKSYLSTHGANLLGKPK